MSDTPRKPASSATARRVSRLPLPAIRKEIWEAACDLVTSEDPRDLCEVLANRFNTSPRNIQRVLVAEGMRHQRVSAALRTGLLGTLDLANEAAVTLRLAA